MRSGLISLDVFRKIVIVDICMYPFISVPTRFVVLIFLFRVIRTRHLQRNFQLVVITHDEEFVENLGRSDFVDYYFRIYKDER